jgi:Domain of Unknown Function (DUF928)
MKRSTRSLFAALLMALPVIPWGAPPVLAASLSSGSLASNPVSPSGVAQVRSAPANSGAIAQRRRRRRLNWRVGVRASRYSVGGFSRSGTCSAPAKLTPFVPPVRPEERINRFKAPVNLTVSSRPTVWVHVADIPPNTEMQFTLQDEMGDRDLYSTRFTLDQESGLVGLRLPDSAPPLKLGSNYAWELAMTCPGEDGSTSTDQVSASGWLQRVNPQQLKPTATFDPSPLARELAKAPELDKPALFAELGIWQDAVTTLLALQQTQPNNRDLQEDWRSLLNGAQLSQFVDAPVLNIRALN